MGVLFKLFVFLLLKHGLSGGGSVSPGESGMNVPIVFPTETMLRLDGDRDLVNDAVTVCFDIVPEAVKENETTGDSNETSTLLRFKTISFEQQKQVMQKIIERTQGRVVPNWLTRFKTEQGS